MTNVPTRERPVAGDRRPPSRGDQQRARIIAAVTELVEVIPIDKLAVSRISEHAGVTRTVFYFYFESKYAVVAAALSEVWTEFEDARTNVTGEVADQSPEALVHDSIVNAIEVWRRHAGLLGACAQARTSDEQLATMWQSFVDDTAASVTPVLAELRKQGMIRPASEDLDALVVALLGMTLWVLLDGSRSDNGEHPDADRMTSAITSIWLTTVWGSKPS